MGAFLRSCEDTSRSRTGASVGLKRISCLGRPAVIGRGKKQASLTGLSWFERSIPVAVVLVADRELDQEVFVFKEWAYAISFPV